ncbi:MAG TPA: fimbria/pilus periplasmic chaperone [Alphaproteobacteria bacterium]|nr:fimbria/pilus periplasmic chaperone [Alphaproteobacteria bacterium]
MNGRPFGSLPALRTALLALTLLAGLAGPAQAFRLVPIEMELAPSGREATQTFRLENDAAEPVAIEITVMAREMGETGEDRLTEAADRFVVYPEQVVLQPNQSQSVRVQWVGEQAPPRELAFRLIAEQLPVDLGRAPPTGGQVRLLVRYVASLYVTPPGAQPQLAVTAAPRDTPEGRRLEVVVANRGATRQILRDPTLTVTAGGKNTALSGEALAGLAGENVLAGATRRFLLPWPSGLAAGGPLAAALTVAAR